MEERMVADMCIITTCCTAQHSTQVRLINLVTLWGFFLSKHLQSISPVHRTLSTIDVGCANQEVLWGRGWRYGLNPLVASQWNVCLVIKSTGNSNEKAFKRIKQQNEKLDKSRNCKSCISNNPTMQACSMTCNIVCNGLIQPELLQG